MGAARTIGYGRWRCTTVCHVKIAVLGGGSWGTTVASLVAHHHDTVLWARNPEVARTVNEDHENPAYVPGFSLDPALTATSDLEAAVCGADFLVMGVPTSGFRRVLEDAAPFMRPWIPVVSLSKGLERGSHLRMTEVIKQVVPGTSKWPARSNRSSPVASSGCTSTTTWSGASSAGH